MWYLRVALLVLSFVSLGCTKDSEGDLDSNACPVLGLNARVIFGTECEPGNSPIVRLAIQRGGTIRECTGSMITSSHVLTSAYCLQGRNVQSVVVTGGPIGVEAKTTRGSTVFVHPEYQDTSGSKAQNDVAILTLADSLNLPVFPLLASVVPDKGDTVSIFGFGRDQVQNAGVLRSGRMEIFFTAYNRFIAIFGDKGNLPCGSDAGGPAIFEGRPTGILGVLSGPQSGCARGSEADFSYIGDPTILDFVRTHAPGATIE
jgi:hypothetical protein